MIRHINVWKQALSEILSFVPVPRNSGVRNLLLVLKYMYNVSVIILNQSFYSFLSLNASFFNLKTKINCKLNFSFKGQQQGYGISKDTGEQFLFIVG